MPNASSTQPNQPFNTWCSEKPRSNAEKKARTLDKLKQWGKNFKLQTTIPRDILPLLAKGDAKQLELVMKGMDLDGAKNNGR